MLSCAWLAAAVVSLVPALRRSASFQAAAAGLAVLGLAVSVPEHRAAPAAAAIRSALPALSQRLLLLNVDGADLDVILTLQAQGKLPALMRLREEGSFGRLKSIVPCVAAVTRTTLVTGRLPFRHGVRSGRARQILGRTPELQVVPVGLGFDLLMSPVMRLRETSIADRKGLALWEIAALAGGSGSGVDFEVDLDRPGGREPPVPDAAIREALAELVDPEAARRVDPAARGPMRDLTEALQADAAAARDLNRLVGDTRPGVVAVSLPGLDRVAHVFLRYARPEEFGDVSHREIDLYGEVLERYYRKIDAVVGRAIEAAGERSCVIVTSTHGMEPVPLRRRLLALAAGPARRSGTHWDGPDGFLFIRGPGVRHGPMPAKGSIADVVPTALYALSLPVARDLDGTILTSVFTTRYTLEHPVSVIGSYDRSLPAP